MPDPISVTVIPDGPLKVSNVSSAQYCGERIQIEGDLWLCRCGDSANAPFCDGSHRGTFNGTSEDPPETEIRVWEGRTVRTYFNKATCMHVFYCKPLAALRERELAGDDDAAAEIMRVVGTCPSGALSYEIKEPSCEEPAPATFPVALDIVEGGEVRIQADFEINAPMQERQAADRATLCRCGRSKNKPWCDGRHKGRRDFR